MELFFTNLTAALEKTYFIAFGASFIWGIFSILLSPCHLASIPLIIGFIDEQDKISTKRALAISSLFALGILLTIATVGAITAIAGRMVGDLGSYSNYFVAFIFLIIGLHLVGVLSIPWSGVQNVNMKRKGFLAAFILGFIFGIALGPCTFAYMAPMLGVVFKVGSNNPIYAIALLLSYGAGHCSIIIWAGAFTKTIQKYLNWNKNSKGTLILRKACGTLVIFGGLYLVYTI